MTLHNPAGSCRAPTKLRVPKGNRERRGRIFITCAWDAGETASIQYKEITEPERLTGLATEIQRSTGKRKA